MKIGFIGTGTMGQPMLNNLITRGFGVVAYDIVPAALDAAVRLGATACGSAANAAKQSDLVVTMLPSSSHVETAYLGAGGVLEGVAKGQPAQPDFRNAYHTQLVLDAVLTSAREGKWVTVKQD